MEHLDLAGVLTTPPQWNLPAFEQQDAIYLSSSRQMLEPIMEETSEDEEYALNSWHCHETQNSDNDCGATTEGESVCGGTSGAGGASFWSSAESDTGSVIRIEITKDNDSTSERDFLCPAKRARRCEDSLVLNTNEEDVVLRRPFYPVEKNNSLERFLNYENFSRDSWGTSNSQQRSSLGSRRGGGAFDDFYSDSDSLSYNSLSRSSSLIQFESLERQLLMQEQHASMTSLGNSSPSLLSFEAQEETQNKTSNNSGNNSANNSRRGSQSSLLKKYESLDGRLHQTYYDLDKLNFDDMDTGNSETFNRGNNLKITPHMAELRSDSESSSEGSEGSCRQQNLLLASEGQDQEFCFKKLNRLNSQQAKKGKSSAENLSEDSGYCEPSMGFGLRRSKSQSLLKNYEKFSEEEEEMENKSLMGLMQHKHNEDFQAKHSQINEFHNLNNNTRPETINVKSKTPPRSPQLDYIRHKQRTEAHSPSPVSSEVSTSSSTSSHSTNSNNSKTSSSSSSSASSTSSATTCASKASFTWLMPSTNTSSPSLAANTSSLSSATYNNASAHSPRVHHHHHHHDHHHDHPAEEEENQTTEISINDLRELQTSNEENVYNFSGKLKNLKTYSPSPTPSTPPLECGTYRLLKENEFKSLEHQSSVEEDDVKNDQEDEEEEYVLNECRNCGVKVLTNSKIVPYLESLVKCQKCDENLNKLNKNTKSYQEKSDCKTIVKNCGELGLKEKKERDKSGEFSNDHLDKQENNSIKSLNTQKYHKLLTDSSCSSTPETFRRLPLTLNGNCSSSESDYSPLRLRKNSSNLMPSWPLKTSSVPNELNTIGRKKKLKKAKNSQQNNSKGFNTSNTNDFCSDLDLVNDSLTSNEEEDLPLDSLNIKRSLSWSFQAKTESTPCVETKNLGLLHQSYHNLALLNLDCAQEGLALKKMSEKRISSDFETEIVCKNNFLLDELSAHYDRTASILNDQPVDQCDSVAKPKAPQRRKGSNSSHSTGEEEDLEADQVQHVQLVIRKPPARQKKDKPKEDRTNSLTQDFTFSSIMQGGAGSSKTFDQDPTMLRTSYAQSLEKCNFDCKELSNHDLSNQRTIPKRRFHSQANNAKKKNLVSSTPNLNAYDFNHQDEIEDDMFVSSAHTSMHQLPMSQTQKPLGILLPAGSRTSFGKEVSFCPVVSKYCWQEQSSEECNDGTEDNFDLEKEPGEESEDELLDNADAMVIYNTKENENIANKYNEEFLKKENEREEVSKEKVVVKELENKQQVANVKITTKEPNNRERVEEKEHYVSEEIKANETELEKTKHTQEESHSNNVLNNKMENETPDSRELLMETKTTVSLPTTLNNETLIKQTDRANAEQELTNKSVNLENNKEQTTNTIKTNNSSSVVARPLSIQLPILSEPPINRAHHILYASQQMLDNFQRQQENEQYEHFNKSQSTQNLSRMSSNKQELQTSVNPKLNNNNEVMKSKFKHEEKHPNSKGFLSRFANGFRFSLRRNKKKLNKDQPAEDITVETKTNGLTKQAKSQTLPNPPKQPDFIHIPLKGPLPNRNGNTLPSTNGNANATNGQSKSATLFSKQKGAKTKDSNDSKTQKVTGKPPIPPHQQQQQQQHQLQQMQKLQSAQSSPQPLVEVGLSRFYTDSENIPAAGSPVASPSQLLIENERNFAANENQQQNFTTSTTTTNNSQSCANNQPENVTDMTAVNTINSNNSAYEFTSPSRASVSQKTQMFNQLSRQSDSQTGQQSPKIGLIETNLDTHETVITGKTRSLINIGPQQQQRFAGNKRLHSNTHQFNHHHHQDDDEDYDDNDEVVVRPDGTVVVIKNTGTNGSSSQAAQIVSVRRPHKSMEFLLDKENQKDVMVSF